MAHKERTITIPGCPEAFTHYPSCCLVVSKRSKIENGIMPPPSKKVIPRLADALNVDKDELIVLAGRIPSSSNRSMGSSGAKIFHDID